MAASNLPTPVPTFNFGELSIRTQADAYGNPWFNANDVCEALGYVNPRDAVSDHVIDPEDVAKRDTLTAGGVQQTNFVNESGIYALIFGSTKAEALKFKKWVTSEVLPAIRKTGQYGTQAPFNPLDHIDPTRVIYLGQKGDPSLAGIFYAALLMRLKPVAYVAKKLGMQPGFLESIKKLRDCDLSKIETRLGESNATMIADALKLRASGAPLQIGNW